ncbi:Ig-like domain-containing protein [Brevibacillus fluminis]|nr:Ig-like domain-containing protein [Brevibacillus fluminis]
MAGRRTYQPLLAKYIKIMLAFFIAFSGWAIVFVNLARPAKAATGDGTPANPYIITTAEELADIRTNMSASYKLGNNIDLSDFSEGEGWEPIGSDGTPFTGTLDGNGHAIMELTINRPDEMGPVGLFSTLKGTVKNLELSDVKIAGKDSVGALAGETIGDVIEPPPGPPAVLSTISNVTVTGRVEGDKQVGGIIGTAYNAQISWIDSITRVSGMDAVGGVAGKLFGSSLDKTIIRGAVIEANEARGTNLGGLAGKVDASTIRTSVTLSGVRGNMWVGGLAGRMMGGSVSDSFAVGSIFGTNMVGGLIGLADTNTIKTSYAAGEVTGTTFVGGLVGKSNDALVQDSYWDTDETGRYTSDGSKPEDGKTTAEMTSFGPAGTFPNWDGDETWFFYDGDYPFLQIANPIMNLQGIDDELELEKGATKEIDDVRVIHRDETPHDISGKYKLVSDDQNIVEVDGNNLVAKNYGTTTVHVQYHGFDQTITVTVPSPGMLQQLKVSSGTLSPAFSGDTLNYTVQVPNSVTDFKLTPKLRGSAPVTTVKINRLHENPQLVESGSSSNAFPLAVGENTFEVTVTEADENERTYTIVVTRAPAPPIPNPDPTPYYPVNEIKFEQKDVKVNEGDDVIVLRPVITPSYATNQTVRWSSSDPDIADVDQNGRVTLGRPGVATITATTADGGKAAVIKITVVAKKTVVKLIPSERVLVVKPNQTARFTVTALYDNDEKQNVTRDKQTAYESKSKDMKFRSERIKVGSKEGTTSFTITYQNKTITIPVIISKITVKSVAISDAPATLNAKDTQQLKLIAALSNKKTKDAAEDATWTTSDPKVITVSDTGELEAVGAGKATITAVYGGKKTKTEVKVTSSTKLDKLQISKRTLRMDPQETQQLTLTAIYTDGTKADITKEATWKVADEAIADVEAGLITAKSAGTTKITVTYEKKKLTISLIVR